MTERAPQPRRRVRATLQVAGITILALLLLTRTSLFREFEAAARDAQARLLTPRQSDRIVIVEITDDDYQVLFGGVSPLAPEVVEQLIRAIRAGRPRAIGVDLDTSHPMYREATFAGDGAPIVWARDAMSCDDADPTANPVPGCRSGVLVPLDYLGGQDRGRFGLVTLEPDHGGTLRRYQRALETVNGPMPSFPAALARMAAESVPGAGPQAEAADTRLLSIEFRRGGPMRLSARTLMEWAVDSTSDYVTDGPLRDRLVVLGGHYRAARDEYPTPLGLMPGVEILTQALETELEGRGRPSPSAIVLLIVQSLTVLTLVTIFARFPFPRAFLLAAVLLPPLALLGGWIVTGVALTGFAYFLPLLIVMLIHILYEKVIEYREALMVELVGNAAEADSVGTHMPHAALDRVEPGLERLLTTMRDFVRRRLKRAPRDDA